MNVVRDAVVSVADSATSTSWADIANNLLNVLQTIALAYMAADRHSVNTLRKRGLPTRRDDPV